MEVQWKSREVELLENFEVESFFIQERLGAQKCNENVPVIFSDQHPVCCMRYAVRRHRPVRQHPVILCAYLFDFKQLV